MSEDVNDEVRLRKYLLGELNEAEQQTLEERLMTDDGLFDLLQVVEDELIEDHLGGLLSSSERGRFDGFFLVTPERRRKLSFAMALTRYITAEAAVAEASVTELAGAKPASGINAKPSLVSGPATWWNRALSSPYLRMAAAAVIVLAVGLGTWRAYVYFRQPQISKGIASLREAYRDQRPTEARITELNYAPPPLTTRGPERDRFDYVALDRAKALIQLEANEHPSSQSYHDLGRLYLAQGDFDKAVDQFEKAIKLDEKNAQLHSDYGAALLEKGNADSSNGETGGRLKEFGAALEHLERALELDKGLRAALFNRALCLQYFMPKQADESWRKYLEVDPDSKWADEARLNLKTLEERRTKADRSAEEIFQDFISAYQAGDAVSTRRAFCKSYSRTGNLIADRLIGSYLDFEAQGRSAEAKTQLAPLAYAGELESRAVGERTASHLARIYGATGPEQRVALQQARSLLKAADAISIKSGYAEAIALYSGAQKAFEVVGDDCEARYADYRIGHCKLRQFGAKRSLRIFERLAVSCAADNHKWLLALVYNSMADAYNSLGEHSKMLYYSGEGLKAAEEIEDTEGAARCYLQLSIGYQEVDDYGKSLALLQQGLLLAGDGLSDLGLIWVFYDAAAEVFRSLDMYAIARTYQEEALSVAIMMDSPLNMSRSYSHLGVLYGRQEKHDQAIETAQRAFEIGKGLSNEPIGREMMANTSLYLGDLNRQKGDYANALSYYDQNLNLYAKLDFPVQQFETHKGKLLCYIAQSNNSAAEDELERALSLFERYRSSILEESNRNHFFDIEHSIYDTAIDFEYSRMKRPIAAFQKSEDSRARSLLDMTEQDARIVHERFGPELNLSARTQPLTLAEIKKQLSPHAQIVQYAALEDKLLIWFVSGSDLQIRETRIGLSELTERVDRYLRRISDPSEDVEDARRDGRELYDLLIKPLEGFLDKRNYLCIVPDKALYRLPFCSLVSQSGDYLVNDYVLGVCPSSTIFIKRSDSARGKEGERSERVLAVGNPSFDRAVFPSLQYTLSTASEAEQIARLYKTSPFTWNGATESAVRREMPISDIIHLATHYVTDRRSSLLSAFLLAKPEGAPTGSASDGVLQMAEIYAMKLSVPRLVVLSACRTGVEEVYKGEGAIGVARPFIAAGVPVVVASLWPVESESTTALMVALHTHRKRGGRSTAEALSLAQRGLMNGDARFRHPYYWAAFSVIGGYATF